MISGLFPTNYPIQIVQMPPASMTAVTHRGRRRHGRGLIASHFAVITTIGIIRSEDVEIQVIVLGLGGDVPGERGNICPCVEDGLLLEIGIYHQTSGYDIDLITVDRNINPRFNRKCTITSNEFSFHYKCCLNKSVESRKILCGIVRLREDVYGSILHRNNRIIGVLAILWIWRTIPAVTTYCGRESPAKVVIGIIRVDQHQ